MCGLMNTELTSFGEESKVRGKGYYIIFVVDRVPFFR